MLNENLSRVRKERGLTQVALSIKLNVVRQTVSKWEKGTAVPDADTLCRIANALDVPVAVLLGDSEKEEMDTATIAKTLAQINEQLAVRNRHTAIAWKVLCLISLIVIGALIWKVGYETKHAASTGLPDIVEVSSVGFYSNAQELTCSFVPSVGNNDITYTVTLSCNADNNTRTSAVAQYEDGICTAVFDKNKLFENIEYCAVLNVNYHGEVRNVILAYDLYFHESGCSWQSQ